MSESGSAPLEGHIVQTESWLLRVPPGIGSHSPLLVIPTVHPRGDRRVVRCAQVALDAGFRVHFLWLGEGVSSADPAVGETLFPRPKNALARISMVKGIARQAVEHEAALWHIHDFYFLAAAKKRRKRGGPPVLYDVHEYYATYYSAKVPGPRLLRESVATAIEAYQVRSAKALGAANVATADMARTFRAAGVRVSVSPNYPLLEQYSDLPSVPFADRRWTVLHTGTLSRPYGTRLLIELIARSASRGLPFEFQVLERYPSAGHEEDFRGMLDLQGPLPNLEMLPARPAHDVPKLLANAGFGLSLLQAEGQNELAVASKSYEYTIAGLVNVVTDRVAQKRFADSYAVPVSGHDDDVDGMLDQMMALADNPEETARRLASTAAEARRELTWEMAVQPGLSQIMLESAQDVSPHSKQYRRRNRQR